SSSALHCAPSPSPLPDATPPPTPATALHATTSPLRARSPVDGHQITPVGLRVGLRRRSNSLPATTRWRLAATLKVPVMTGGSLPVEEKADHAWMASHLVSAAFFRFGFL
ncbi:unnamed protein product, partial [Urochloa humidicola]